MNTELVKRIKKDVYNRKDAIVDAYVAKRYGEPDGKVLEGEFDKTIMVKVDNVWYRCSCHLNFGIYEVCDPGDTYTPPFWYDEYHYCAHIYTITEEKTKQLIYKDV